MVFGKLDIVFALFFALSLGLVLFLHYPPSGSGEPQETLQEAPEDAAPFVPPPAPVRREIDQSYFDRLTAHDQGETPEVLAPDPVDPNDPDSTPYATNLPASVLVAPFYTSNASNTTAENTRFSITNTRTSSVDVHLFFIDGSSCEPLDTLLSLTARQTVTFLASDIDPGIKGWLIAIEIDPSTFLASGNNSLTGNVAFKTASGHSGGYNMVGFRALNSAPDNIGTLQFDDVNFEKWPDNLILPEFPSNLDNNSNRLILVSPPQLAFGIGPGAFNYSATAFDDNETGTSSTFTKSGCFSDTAFNSTFPVSGINGLVPSGHTGWLKLNATNSTGATGRPILGLYMNYNPTAGASNFNGAHTLSGYCGTGTCPALNVTHIIN